MAAVFTDVLFALGAGVALARGLFPDTGGAGEFLAPVLTALALSCVNHVILVLLFRASLGKLLWGLRVVRVTDAGRPRFLRAVRRWLFGYLFFILIVLLEDADAIGEACGLRTVRRRDLRS
ncbi:RDD family protein [Streptomyces sp. XM4011]|uniref:RDD family protein n=1 Tax=Streptomyces TaxID=1883 RepID=UPI001FF80E71|nr:RDD family protein [Streptomyces sp. XM4011]MCK1815656.1 RDD family protein [Streptomyces sp. XM4011]